MGLTGEQKKRLCQAICRAFNEAELKQCLAFKLNKDLDLITINAPFEQRVFDLVQHANRGGWIDEFIAAVHADRPDDPELKNLGSGALSDIAARVRAGEKAVPKVPLELYWSWIKGEHAVPHGELTAPDGRSVFVDIALSLDLGAGPQGNTDLAGDRGQGLRRLLEFADSVHPGVTGRWFLRGGPGSGKTVLLRHLAAELASAAEVTQIPVFSSFSQLMNGASLVPERIERLLTLAHRGALGLAHELGQAGDEGRLVVLLDGLDEVGEEQQDDARRLLEVLRDLWPRSAILVSSRPVEPPKGFRVVDLLPLDRPRKINLLTQLLGGTDDPSTRARATTVLDRIEVDLGLRQLTGDPLHLTLLSLLLRDHQEPDRNRLAFYGQSIDRLLEGRHRPKQPRLQRIKAVRDALRHIALALVKKDREAVPFQDLEEIVYDLPPAQRRALSQVPAWRNDLGAFLLDVASRTGILRSDKGFWENWSFLHPIFRDALAAEALAVDLQMAFTHTHVTTDPRSRLADLAVVLGGQERQWAEIFALLIGGLPEPDREVVALVRERPSLGLLTIATTRGLHAETLESVLKMTRHWQQRRQVITRVFDLVVDPERAIQLLDRLRETTQRGNDLYFIEEVLMQAGRRWPTLAGLVQEVVDRMFDHIERPATELFAQILTGSRAELGYWCPVPPGSFSMGRDAGPTEEQPVHQITIDGGFRLAATPVTRQQYAAFDRERGGEWLAELPMAHVTWFEATAFCRWLERRGAGFAGARLPLEAEWEYACRHGDAEAQWWCGSPDRLHHVAWYRENSALRPHPVGQLQASSLGLYDLHGNVREWCWDAWTRNYQNSTTEGTVNSLAPPPPADQDALRVLRGGCFMDSAQNLRSTARAASLPYLQSELVGFRVLLPGLSDSAAKENPVALRQQTEGKESS